MGIFLFYIFKSAISLMLLFLFWKLLMKNDTFYGFNRFALLGIILISYIVPFIDIEANDFVTPGAENGFPEFRMTGMPVVGVDDGFSILYLSVTSLLLLYVSGVIFLLFRNIITFYRLRKMTLGGNMSDISEYFESEHGVNVVVVPDSSVSPFSWLNYIVISEQDMESDDLRVILYHELVHVRKRHTLDLIIADILIILQWFNPFVWLLKSELQDVHEYEVDRSVIKNGMDIKKYQILLIRKAAGSRLYSIANSLNHSKLKKRITMMMRKKSNQWAYAKYLFVFPVVAVTVAAFARPEITSAGEKISSVKVNDLYALIKDSNNENRSVARQFADSVVSGVFVPDKTGHVCQSVDRSPEFPGGFSELRKFLSQYTIFPDVYDGKAVPDSVQVEFTVTVDGSVVNPRVIDRIDPFWSEKVCRIVNSMPKWIPGEKDGEAVNSNVTLLVFIKKPRVYVRKDIKKEYIITEAGGRHYAGSPVVIVDGTACSDEELEKLLPEDIAAVSLMDEKQAIKEYGEKGRYGAVLITTRKDK